MASPESEEREIPIRCPGCGARFRVGDELMGRMVECGSCERRFRVAEDVVTRRKRFYPGESRDPRLDSFGRIPARAPLQPNFETVHYDQGVSPQAIEPTPPLRVLAALLGAALAIGTALILIFGGSPGGILDGATTGRRLVLAGFVTVIAGALLIFGNPKARAKALSFSALTAAVLMALPFVFKNGTEEILLSGLEEEEEFNPGGEDEEVAAGDPHAELKEQVGYGPLAAALERYRESDEGEEAGVPAAAGDSPEGTAMGLWLRGLRERHRAQVRDYLIRATGASEESWTYPRGEDECLLVMIDVPEDFQRMESICGRFGKVVRTIKDLSLIEVLVTDESFVRGDIDKLIDPDDPAFYDLNLTELESIDFVRARDAARRLAGAEPKLYRPDIVARLQELLRIGDAEMREGAAAALQVWGQEGDGTTEVAREVAMEIAAESSSVPRSLVQLLAKAQDPGSVDIVHQLWLAQPSEWEALYGDFGAVIEDKLLEGYADYSLSDKRSATRLLGRVGTDKSLAKLEAEKDGAGGELAVLIDRAIQAIQQR